MVERGFAFRDQRTMQWTSSRSAPIAEMILGTSPAYRVFGVTLADVASDDAAWLTGERLNASGGVH